MSKTWLLTWNPKLWPWDDTLTGYNEMRNEIKEIGVSYSKWTCGINKSIKKGDRIFLIKLGVNPRGMVASGYAESDVFEGTHWDNNKIAEGKKARRIYIRFDKILNIDDNEILHYDKLLEISGKYNWSPMCSGVSIDESVAMLLEDFWKK